MKNTENRKPAIVKLVGQRVRQIRKERGLTQAQLAERINKTPEMVCHLENGTASTKISTLDDMAEILDVEPYQFLTDRADIEHMNITGKRLEIFNDLEDADNETIDLIAALVHKIVAK